MGFLQYGRFASFKSRATIIGGLPVAFPKDFHVLPQQKEMICRPHNTRALAIENHRHKITKKNTY